MEYGMGLQFENTKLREREKEKKSSLYVAENCIF